MLLLDNFTINLLDDTNQFLFEKVEFDEVVDVLIDATDASLNIIDCISNLTLDAHVRKLFAEHSIILDNDLSFDDIKFNESFDSTIHDSHYVAVIAHCPSPTEDRAIIEWWLIVLV